jgi:hypothetical protein
MLLNMQICIKRHDTLGKHNDILVYDFNWTVPNTDIKIISFKGFITLYERAKVELLKIGLEG